MKKRSFLLVATLVAFFALAVVTSSCTIGDEIDETIQIDKDKIKPPTNG